MEQQPKRRGGKLLMWAGIAVAALIVLMIILPAPDEDAAVPAEDPSDPETQLAAAMCSDLEDGASLFQMHAQAVEHYRGLPGDRSEDAVQLAAAELQDLATSEHCPEFRDDFEATFAYTDWIAPQE